jgi:hypothetical protein
LWLVCIGLGLFSVKILSLRDGKLLHRVMIMVLPLLLLLLVFMMLSEMRPASILANIAVHLGTLFVVAMVCHGGLALDRPDTAHLTEYFLWVSFGGVVGGLFNGLVAPLAFNAIIEYQLVLVVACLLLPPLGTTKDGHWARLADLGLVAVFLGMAVFLGVLRWLDGLPDFGPLFHGSWSPRAWNPDVLWALAGLACALGLGALAARYGWGSPPRSVDAPPETRKLWRVLDRVMDLALPLALGLLVFGLYFGLTTRYIDPRIRIFANLVNLKADKLRGVLIIGLPAVLCYTFVERAVRFGLGLGALLLASALAGVVDDSPLFQARSFFGVLKVEGSYPGRPYHNHRLVHGTTLHGTQFTAPSLRAEPQTYYHRTGPIGTLCAAYNTDPRRPMGLIGLGTGTMACYALEGQQMTFYDIDPVVKHISYDTDEYFTYVADARRRGAKVDLILGDARLTLDANPLEGDDRYGILVVDAFSSDAIPVHLITREALAMYLTKVREDGLICFHISNRYLDLEPVLGRLAEDLGLVGMHMSDDDEKGLYGKSRSHWVVLARDKGYLKKLEELSQRREEQNKGWNEVQAAISEQAKKAPRAADEEAPTVSGFGALVYQAVNDQRAGRGATWEPVKTTKERRDDLEVRRKKTEEAQKAWQKARGAPGEEEARDDLEYRRRAQRKAERALKVGVWTDDYSNLLSIFDW